MKLNTYQEDYIYNTVKAVESMFNDVVGQLGKINDMSARSFNSFSKNLTESILDGIIQDEKLNLTAKQFKEHSKAINESLKETFKNEYEMQKKAMEDMLLNNAVNYYMYKDFLLNGSFNLDPLENMNDFLNIVNKEVHGKDWSSRLWTAKKETMNDLNKLFKDLGKGYIKVNDVKARIKRYNDKNNYAVNRLIRNELVRVQSGINEKFDKDNGIEYQLFTATLDKRTTDICRGFDGNVYKRDDKSKPIPPNSTHIQCRSCLIGIPDKDWKPSTRRDNETDEIIDYKNYKEWAKDNGITIKDNVIIPNPNKDIMSMNYNELEAKAKELNITFGELTGKNKPVDIDLDVLRYGLSSVEKLQTEYPILKNHALRLTQGNLGKGTLGQCWNTGKIDLNLSFYSKGSSYVKNCITNKIREGKWHSKTDNYLNATFVHEYGHFVSTVLMREKKIFDWDKVVKDIRAEVKKEYKILTGETVAIKDIHNVLSQYGATSPHETFAEAFQENFNCDNPRPYAQAFKIVLERWLK